MHASLPSAAAPQLLAKGLTLLAEPRIATQLLDLRALPTLIELCFRPPAATNVPVEESQIPCEALLLVAATVAVSEAAAVELVDLGLVRRRPSSRTLEDGLPPGAR